MNNGNKLFDEFKNVFTNYCIEDITVVHGQNKDSVLKPDGYELIDVNLNEGAGGEYIYFCIKRGKEAAKAVDDVCFITGIFNNLKAPEGYVKVDVDLNKGARGKYIYLCKRYGNSNPIKDIKIVVGTSRNVTIPEGYQKVNQDLNEGAGGKYIYLCYKK